MSKLLVPLVHGAVLQKNPHERDPPAASKRRRPTQIGRTEEISRYTQLMYDHYTAHKRKTGKGSVFVAFVKTFKYRIILQIFLNLTNNATRVLYTFFLLRTLENMSDPTKTKGDVFVWAGGLFGVIIISIFSLHHDFFNGGQIASRGKLSLVGMLYQKIVKLNLYSLNKLSVGKVVNIVANDVNIFDQGFFFVFYLISAIPILAVTTLILWSIFGVSCLSGLGCIILTYPAQKILSYLAIKSLRKKNTATDERIKLTNEAIDGIRLLKMYGWEITFSNFVLEFRNKEHGHLKRMSLYEWTNNFVLSKIVPMLAPLLIYITYYYVEGRITAAQIFATIILMSTVRVQIIRFGTLGIKFADECKVIFARIQQIMEMPEVAAATDKVGADPKDKANSIELAKFGAGWQEENSADSQHLTLAGLDLNIPSGTLCSIVGRIGAGKSTLLLSFLQEVPKIEGQLRFKGRVAYVEQEPTIFSGTVRSNILFGREFDDDLYKNIIEYCCLEDDLKLWPNSDLTEIGEKGINMSGGQRARVALARAIYSQADIYLLDDPLSAVDAKVAKRLFDGIKTLLKGKTVLLATHQVHFAREAELILVLEDGGLRAAGTFNQILVDDPTIVSMFEDQNLRKTSAQQASRKNSKNPPNTTPKDGEQDADEEEEVQEEEQPVQKKPVDSENKGKLFKEETSSSGSVNLRTYLTYLKSMRSPVVILLFIIIALSIEIAYVYFSRVLASWSSDEISSTKAAFGILGALVGGSLIGCILRNYCYVHLILRASNTAHNEMLQKVVRSPTVFFDSNPSGRILNRFSNDVGVLDRFLPLALDDVLTGILHLGSLLVSIFAISPLILAPGVILMLVIWLIVRFTHKAVVESRSIELVTKSPIYSHFSLTLNGLIIVRSYQQQNHFDRLFTGFLNNNTKAFIRFYDFGRFLGLYIDLAAGLFSIGGISILIATRSDDVGLSGMAASFLLTLSTYMQFAVRQSITTHMMMASPARIQAFMKLPEEAALVKPTDKELINRNWPARGEIKFNNVFMRYREDLDPVIKGLTLSVVPGEKIGCIGRTGAGKSSILQILFRMIEIDRPLAVVDGTSNQSSQEGVYIDGQDISTIGLHTLRNSISIIPQTPFVFMGNVKRNLDPLSQQSDEQLMTVLEEVGLKQYIDELPNGLNTDMSSSASVFSVGQKQLICLARAILKKTRIIVLDEATANVDFETDNFIQKALVEKFGGCTVFTIAHRLSTIASYDKVLVMSQGRVAEYDLPYRLLVKKLGDKEITNVNGHFAQMVLQTGPMASRGIFKKTLVKYQELSQKSSH